MTLDQALPLIGMTPLPGNYFHRPADAPGGLTGIGLTKTTHTLWTLTIDNDGGTTTELYTDRTDLDARAHAICAEEWDAEADGPMPDDWREAYEHIDNIGHAGFSLVETEHEVALGEGG